MAVPDFQTLMRPVLALHVDGADHAARDVVAAMADKFGLTPEERVELIPSGRQPLISNRVAWAVSHMAQAGLLTRPRRGSTRVTERGRKVLAEHPSRVDMRVLKEFPEYIEFRARRRDSVAGDAATDAASGIADVEPAAETPPREAIPKLVAEAHDVLAAELLDRLRAGPPEFLERAVLQLLVKMGYGGPESIHHLGGPGDQGLDGLVRQDPLGLDVVYVQAKRYQSEHVVQRPDVQAFVGALQGAQADRGIFITTSRFPTARPATPTVSRSVSSS